MKNYEEQLTGGHPNSLGNTESVVEQVLDQPETFDELFETYFSQDEVVRLRVSSCMKRVTQKKKELVIPYLPRLLTEISSIDQASTQWTLAILYDLLKNDMSADQQKQALGIMKNNLLHPDWIVLNTTMNVLWDWSKKDSSLKTWLKPHLQRLSEESRKSVSGKAKKLLSQY